VAQVNKGSGRIKDALPAGINLRTDMTSNFKFLFLFPPGSFWILRIGLSDQATINYDSSFADCLKAYLLIVNLDQHKMIVLIKARCPEAASLIDVSAATLPACAGNEILDSLLRFCAFVDMIVTGEGDLDTITIKQRLKTPSQTHR
jgi:hypothetical protein